MASRMFASALRRGVSVASSVSMPVRAAAQRPVWARRAAAVHVRSVATAAASLTPHPSESFLGGTNAVYVEEMYRHWKLDPTSVHTSWQVYFANVEAGAEPGAAFLAPASVQPGVTPTARGGGDPSALSVASLVRAYQVRGHHVSNLDPLQLQERQNIPELDYRTYGFTEADLDKEFALGSTGVTGMMANSKPMKLRDIIATLETTYCGTTGYEYMHISDREKANWLRERIEVTQPAFSKEERVQMLDRMTYAETFEEFLKIKYGSKKRFGLEGCESLIPGMKTMIDRATELSTEYIAIGMPHRGRLNVLCNVVRKPAEEVFQDFDDGVRDDGEGWSGSGDVKYHLGQSFDRTYDDGRKVHLTLMANPSHLEAVDPVVVGKVRAQQDRIQDDTRDKVLGVLMHGDAAFAGQGVVFETLHLSSLRKYTTGGTVHIVVNNQVGFTTNPRDSRSSTHPSDVGKAFDVPIFHVNADDVEAVCRVFKLAVEYRQEFNTDVIIDLIGYRRMGHNEGDEPKFTQPRMYTTIAKHPTTLNIYRDSLVASGVVTAEEAAGIQTKVKNVFEDAFASFRDYEAKRSWMSSAWEGLNKPDTHGKTRNTGVSKEALTKVFNTLTTVPEGFNLHRTLERSVLPGQRAMMETGEGINWGTAEALAFGTLLLEGSTVRLSGQDVQRGTFSHRHSKWHDQKDFTRRYMPLANLSDDQGQYWVANSSLSEFAVLGFEVGYSLHHPDQLVLWEAQFGDFANGAQVMIDQFVSCSEQKWYRQLGLVMLLPHGQEGAGPEHSSARLERFLQMCDDPEDVVPDMDVNNRMQIQSANWQIVNVTTPANYFHVLRRQVARDFRKPLIVMSPKWLLRLPACRSNIDEFTEGTRFKRFIPDERESASVLPAYVKRVILCSGKVYYDLVDKREELGLTDSVVIARVEQIAPFPFDLVSEEIAKYPNADVTWVQEEPRNQGAWTYVRPRIETAVRHFKARKRAASFRVSYAGRDTMGATAVGSERVHKLQQAALLEQAFADLE